MIQPSFEIFKTYAARANRVPVYREYLADFETPVSVLSRFADDENVFLLESVEGGERFGRYCFIGINPHAVFSVENGKPFLRKKGLRTELDASEGAFFALRKILADIKVAGVGDLPPLFGGAVGFMSYETVNEFEKLPRPKAPLDDPSACFLLCEDMIVFDNVRHTVKLIACARIDEFADFKAAYDDACQRIEAIHERLAKPAPVKKTEAAAARVPPLQSNMTKAQYFEKVDLAKQYIRDGEIIQMVFSQKFTTKADIPPIQLYRALRLINPSPYTFFLKTGGRVLVGSSPETMVKLDCDRAILRPIAGTRRRGRNPAEDIALADELLRDEKEKAEHLMLVDLGRNDLGRVSLPGSVQVKDFMRVERYSHVMHLVSDVESVLKPDADAFDLIKSVFPAGTLSGAPKVRAMQLIHELEPEPRNTYGGAVGYFSYGGPMDMAITIRTLRMENGEISIQAGGGIVYDSDPEKEFDETVNKAGALFKSVRMAAEGLQL